MQSVYILRAEKKFTVVGLFAPLGQGNVRGIGFSVASMGATIRVILPNESWIFLPGFNVGQFVMAVAAPVGPLKDRNSALRADPSPGEDKYTAARLHTNCSLPPAKLAYNLLTLRKPAGIVLSLLFLALMLLDSHLQAQQQSSPARVSRLL